MSPKGMVYKFKVMARPSTPLQRQSIHLPFETRNKPGLGLFSSVLLTTEILLQFIHRKQVAYVLRMEGHCFNPRGHDEGMV